MLVMTNLNKNKITANSDHFVVIVVVVVYCILANFILIRWQKLNFDENHAAAQLNPLHACFGHAPKIC